MLKHHYVNDDGNESLTLVIDGVPETVAINHANFPAIRDYVVIEKGDDEEHVKTLLNARRAVPAALVRLSERITLKGGNLHFDGELIDNALSRHIIRLAQAGDAGLTGFVRFMENLALNPSKLSRIHLFKWIEGRNFTITEDGLIVAYKSVKRNSDGDLVSITSGSNKVTVNDEEFTGHVPNPIGATVEIARNEVDPKREADCSYGLHVGTWGYVETFGISYNKVILKVIVNPRDVVAVPSGNQSQKMRVCRYVIDEAIEQEINKAIIFTEVTDGPLWDNDEDYEPERQLDDEDIEEDDYSELDAVDIDDDEDDDRFGFDDDEEDEEDYDPADNDDYYGGGYTGYQGDGAYYGWPYNGGY